MSNGSAEKERVPIWDGHTHVGSSLAPGRLVELMERYGIELALVSNLSSEPDSKANQEMVEVAERYPRLKGLAWANPTREGNKASDIEPFFQQGLLVGMKIHPVLSVMSVADPRLVPYMELCQKYDVPLQCHTAPDYYCNPQFMLELARRHPRVKIVMIHMNLGNEASDNDDAIEVAKQAPNLYLDTS